MTFRAVILGTLGSLLIAGGGYINNRVLELETIAAGHQIPVGVIGLLIVGMVTINPLLMLFRRKWALRPAEAGVIVMLMMVGCSIPGRGLLEQFTSAIGMPNHWNRQRSGWQKNNLMGYLRSPDGTDTSMLVGGTQYDDKAMEGFAGNGLAGEDYIGLDSVPWDRWARPLQTWMPLMVLLAVASVCLILVVHRQWSEHERLRYPIADFTTSLVERGPGQVVGSIFRSKLFWLGLGIVLFIRTVNGINVWNRGTFINIPMVYDFTAVLRKYPMLRDVWLSSWDLAHPTIYPIVIGFSFFLASDISLSLGLSQPLFVLVGAALVTAGVDLVTDYDIGGPLGYHRAGAYFGAGLILLYVGRRYYGDVLKRALTFRRVDGVDNYAAWACRLLLLSIAGMAWIMVSLGLELPLALLIIALMLLSFLIVSRISAETGLFFIQPGWQPFGILLGLMGGYAMGPRGVLIGGIICAVMCIDQSQGLMPYFINGLKICTNLKVRPARVGFSAVTVYVLGLAVAVPIVIWANYNFGIPRYDYSYRRIPTMSFRAADTETNSLKLSDELDESENFGPLERFTKLRPKKSFPWFAGAGVALVVLCSVLRLRFSWWPLHPVLFLVWTTYPLRMFSTSFLIGWFVKTMVTRLGGHRAYEACRPLMFGAIAGDVLGALLFMIVGAVSYAQTGTLPIIYRFFPR